MSVILLTNDDGIYAPGLRVLEEALEGLGEVWVVAPNVERSACGRSVTLDRPLRVEEMGPKRLSVDGTPVDCVLLAFRRLIPDAPAVVVAGINRGLNVGEDVDYSGTVGAASEGAHQGSPASVAISLDSNAFPQGLAYGADFCRALVRQLLENPLPKRALLNVNLPATPTSRIRYTRQGKPLETGEVLVGTDPRGKTYYWIAERPLENQPSADTDRGALKAGCISMSLLSLDRDHHGSWASFQLAQDGYLEDPP